jgi:tryptophan synthase alpha chain
MLAGLDPRRGGAVGRIGGVPYPLGMNRIDAIFRELRSGGAKALMPFVTAGDPDLATTELLLPALQRAGASVCELGIPFSDPIADGPVIQESMGHALARGLHPAQVLEVVRRQRAKLTMGLMAMVSYSIVYRLGIEAFVRDCAAAGIDGLIIPDLPVEEAGNLGAHAGAAGLVCSFLIAPTTPPERAAAIARASSGFVYVVARGGLTGEQAALPAELPERLTRLRRETPLPIVVGFGISTPQQVRQVTELADAVIVGSALVRRLAAHRAADNDAGRAAAVAEAEDFVRQLCGGLPPAAP